MKTYTGIALSAVAILCCADQCKPEPPDKNVAITQVPKQQVEGARFSVERCGGFNAGYDNNFREILIITDHQDHHKYLGVTGVGITEMHSQTEDKETAWREE